MRGRLDYIEGMRGVAALYVAAGHVVTLVDPYRGIGRPSELPHWLATMTTGLWYGHLAVAAFIVLSGFCLQLALFNRGDGRLHDLRGFLLRRCRRILPPYYACLALSIPVAVYVSSAHSGLPWAQYVPVTQENVFAHLFLVHNLDPAWMYKINGVLWSIAIEFQLYFVFPLLVALIWRLGKLLAVGASWGIAAWMLQNLDAAPKLYVWYLPLFTMGMAAAHATFARETKPWMGWAGLTVAAGAIVMCVQTIGQTKELMPRDAWFGLAVCGLLVSGAALPNGPVRGLFGLRGLVGLGAFSYSLYLMHHPIYQVVYANRPEWVSGPVDRLAYVGTVGAAAALVGSYLFYRAFERPFVSRPAPKPSARALVELPVEEPQAAPVQSTSR